VSTGRIIELMSVSTTLPKTTTTITYIQTPIKTLRISYAKVTWIYCRTTIGHLIQDRMLRKIMVLIGDITIIMIIL
jgi:hypothetical protein